MSEDVISKLIGNLSIRKAPGLDGLSERFLKDGVSVDLDHSLDGNYIAKIFLRKATHDSNSYGDMQNF